ncbi:hypothetical protein D9M70_488550 [compost metagenome]
MRFDRRAETIGEFLRPVDRPIDDMDRLDAAITDGLNDRTAGAACAENDCGRRLVPASRPLIEIGNEAAAISVGGVHRSISEP